MRRLALPLIPILLLVGACAGASAPGSAATTPSAVSVSATPSHQAPPPPIDPRTDGLEIGLAEWTVTLEAVAVRPGRMTFVIHNAGTRTHGFEIKAEGGDSSGHGSGDGLEAETRLLAPGESTKLTLDLAPGVYKVECPVPGHDDLGMEAVLEVRTSAPLVTPAAPSPDAVAIRGLAFRPPDLSVPAGTEVTWTNQDPTPHTVTADGGGFESDVLAQGETFAWTFETSGTVTYHCAIHPDMRGTITVG
jgi:plastocyanin